MKKLVRTSLVNTPNRRGIKDLNIQFYSHDKNNAGFEFVIKNETDLSEYTAKVLFHFVLSDSTWESAGTIEGNVVKATFNTDLIARCEEVLGFLFLDSESNSLDVFKFKFNVVLSEIDKNEVEKRKIKHVADIEALELVTRSELRDELAKIQVTGGVDLSGYLTTSAANETFATKQELGTYATKDELPSISGLVTTEQLTTAKNSVVEEINNKGYITSTVVEETYAKKSDLPAPYNDSTLVQKIGQLEARVDNDTVYDDTPLKERVTVLESKVDKDTVYNDEEVKQRLTVLENKPAVDTSHFITNETLDNKNYLTTTVAEETYAKKSEIPQAYNDSALVERVTALESRPTASGSVDTSNLVTKTELKDYHYVTIEELPIPLYEQYTTDDFNEFFERDRSEFINSNTHKKGKVFIHTDSDYHTTSPLVYTGNAEHQKIAEYDAVLYTAASSLPDGYSLESINDDNKVTFLSNKNFSDVVPKEELKNIIREVGGSTGSNIDTSHFITDETLESKGFLTTHQDISNLATKEELAKAVTKEELEEKHYVTSEQISSTYATKSEIPQPYSDTELVKRITILENRQDNDTVYDDAELKRRVTALEEKPSVDTSNFVTTAVLESKGYLTTHQDISNLVTKQELHEATEIDYSNIVTTDELEPYAKKSELPAPYNDSALVSRVSALESKQDKDTVYDDTKVKERLTALESKPTVDTSNLVTKSELNTLRPLPTLSINNNTLSIAGGNSVALPSNKPLTGSGTPEGKVIANPGDTYVNSNVSLGDYYYYKERNPGRNTGWKVLYGSMGVNINLTTGGRIRFSRENYFVNASISDLTISLDVLKRGDRRGFYQDGENVVIRFISTKQFDVRESIIPQGFRPIGNFLVPAYNKSGDSIGLFKFEQLYGVVKLILNDITLQNVTSEMLKGINSGLIVYPTQEAWMTKLP
nr:MAG TPA: hypothetical protein [Caudoviricetes sp.]